MASKYCNNKTRIYNAAKSFVQEWHVSFWLFSGYTQVDVLQRRSGKPVPALSLGMFWSHLADFQ